MENRYRIRQGRASDIAELARLHASVQLQAITGGQPHAGVAAWVEDLLDGHPSVSPDHFLVAEEVASGQPVASLVELRQDWTLSGVRLPVAQIELVGTAPEHRGHRLTDRLFAALHERHSAEDIALQVIEGIPYFYRRLGYHYALANDGAPTLSAATLTSAAPEHPMLRSANATDAADLAQIDQQLAEDDTLFCPRDANVWRYEITQRRPADLVRREVAVLAEGSDVSGYLVHGSRLSASGELAVVAAACKHPHRWPLAAPAMLGYLAQVGHAYQAAAGQPFTAVRPLLSPQHPLIRFGAAGTPKRPRGWYVRTGDAANLLGRLQPLLRQRWHAAGLRWPGPTLTIDAYGRAARFGFTNGELTSIETTRGVTSPSTDAGTHVAIPPGALLQLALGNRSLPEVLDAWPDCLLRDRLTEIFVTAAFPQVPVHIWPRN
jgi:hypothetical protein